LVITDAGGVSIENFMRLTPRVIAPFCIEGRVYFSSLDDKVRVCSGGTWKALQFE